MYKKITTIEEYSDAVQYNTNNGDATTKKYAPCIRVDVPLMIKLLEYSREESTSDTDLHLIAENMIYNFSIGSIYRL